LSDNVVRDSQFVDFVVKEQCDFAMVCTVIKRYHKILNFTTAEMDNKVYPEVLFSAIPQHVWDSAICYEVHQDGKKKTYYRMDAIWSYLYDMKIPGIFTDSTSWGKLLKLF